MVLKNKTNGKIIIQKVEIRDDILGKAIGLMFSKKKKKALVFENSKEIIVSLHMFFVFYAIDVLYLDSEKKIVEIKKKFLPFTFYYPRNKAKYVIEIPTSYVKKESFNVGDILEF